MARKHEVSRLHAELESFGRRAKALTAGRLQAYPGILAALFGDEALVDPEGRRVLAERVERAMLGLIESTGDFTDRRIAEAVFAAKPEFYNLGVGQRQAKIEKLDGIKIRDLYKDRRARIVADMAHALQEMFSDRKPVVHDAMLSSRALRAARQLYRSAQSVLVCVDASAACAQYSDHLQWVFRSVRDGQRLAQDVPHGWLLEYCSDAPYAYGGGGYRKTPESLRSGGCDIHLAPHGRNPVSDLALWHYAQCERCLRDLLADPSGRSYLKGCLPDAVWWNVQAGDPFEREEIDRILSVESHRDDPRSYVSELTKTREGMAILRRWLELLSAPVGAKWGSRWERHDLLSDNGGRRLSNDLLLLCMSLQRVFPDETAPALGSQYEEAVFYLLQEGLGECGVIVGGAEVPSIEPLYQDVLESRADRYAARAEGEPVWRENAQEAEWIASRRWYAALEGVDTWDDD